jgi:hypothetical protein
MSEVLHFAGRSLRQLGLLSKAVPSLSEPVWWRPAPALKKLSERLEHLTATGYVQPLRDDTWFWALCVAVRDCQNVSNDDTLIRVFKNYARMDIQPLVSMQQDTFDEALKHFKFPGFLKAAESGDSNTREALAKRGFTFKEESTEPSDVATVASEEPQSVFSGMGGSDPTERGSLTRDRGTEDEGTEDEIKRTDKGSTLTPSNRDPVSSVYREGSLPP